MLEVVQDPTKRTATTISNIGAAIKPYYSNGKQSIYIGDNRVVIKEIGLKRGSVSLMLTDPPYIPGFEWCWKRLGFWGSRYLKDQGSVFTLLGVMNMPDAIQGLGSNLNYWWTCGMFHNVPFPYRGSVQCRWKPGLWYCKGEKPDIKRWPCDLMPAVREKGLHPWQQPIAWVEYWMSHLSKQNELVLDPFMGAGTTLIAAKHLNRRCIGIEFEEKTAEKAARRLEKDVSFPIVIESHTPANSTFGIDMSPLPKKGKKNADK